MGKIIKGALLAVAIFIVFLLVVTLYENLTAETEFFKPIISNNDNFSQNEEQLQFYQDMRFQDLPVTYKIDMSCSQKNNERISEAFSVLAEKAELSFAEVQSDEYIFISCNETHNQQADGRGMFIAGEGGPLDILRTGLFHLILKSKVLLFSTSGSIECKKPNIEIHEILHAFGFEHSEKKDSILYPVNRCSQEISQDITNEIKRLYSFPSLPDLKFEYINASEKGRYLNFKLSVKNQGLKYVDRVFIGIYTETEEVDSFDLGNITTGGSKILTVENLRLPSSKIKNLTFFADPENKIREIREDNNQAELYMQ